MFVVVFVSDGPSDDDRFFVESATCDCFTVQKDTEMLERRCSLTFYLMEAFDSTPGVLLVSVWSNVNGLSFSDSDHPQ